MIPQHSSLPASIDHEKVFSAIIHKGLAVDSLNSQVSASLSKMISRMPFIDFARGVVMIVMAWDHVSGFWHRLHHGGEGILGRAPPFYSLTWFLERFVSHWCAPTFIFLAGTVLAISAGKRLLETRTMSWTRISASRSTWNGRNRRWKPG